MPSMKSDSAEVTRFIDRADRWQGEMRALRRVLRGCDVAEEIKWGKPCYTASGGNIAIMQPFKAHLSLMFFKGALMEDPAGVLRSQGENTRSAKRIEFTSPEQVAELASVVRTYVDEAIAVETAGVEVPRPEADEVTLPPELEAHLREDAEYRRAFEALTPGRKRSHVLHIAGAKQAQTRERRVEKCRTKVLAGKGFNER